MTPELTKLSRRKIVSKKHILTVFSSHIIEALIFGAFTITMQKLRLKRFFDLLQNKHTEILCSCIFCLP